MGDGAAGAGALVGGAVLGDRSGARWRSVREPGVAARCTGADRSALGGSAGNGAPSPVRGPGRRGVGAVGLLGRGRAAPSLAEGAARPATVRRRARRGRGGSSRPTRRPVREDPPAARRPPPCGAAPPATRRPRACGPAGRSASTARRSPAGWPSGRRAAAGQLTPRRPGPSHRPRERPTGWRRAARRWWTVRPRRTARRWPAGRWPARRAGQTGRWGVREARAVAYGAAPGRRSADAPGDGCGPSGPPRGAPRRRAACGSHRSGPCPRRPPRGRGRR